MYIYIYIHTYEHKRPNEDWAQNMQQNIAFIYVEKEHIYVIPSMLSNGLFA